MSKKFTVNSRSATPTTSCLMPPEMEEAPNVYYTPHVFETIKFIIAECAEEVGWLGLVEKQGNDYLVTDIYIPEQIVHAAETDISSDTLSALVMEILDAGKDSSKLYYWGHSHVNMGVSPSAQDERQIEEYLTHSPVFIRGIYNKKGDSKVDVYNVTNNVVHQCVNNGVAPTPLSEKTQAALKKMLATNVKKRTFASYDSLQAHQKGRPSGDNHQSQLPITQHNQNIATKHTSVGYPLPTNSAIHTGRAWEEYVDIFHPLWGDD